MFVVGILAINMGHGNVIFGQGNKNKQVNSSFLVLLFWFSLDLQTAPFVDVLTYFYL